MKIWDSFKCILLAVMLVAAFSASANAVTVGYWKFDEGIGQEIANSGGSSTFKLKRGTLTGEDDDDPAWVAGGIDGSALVYRDSSGGAYTGTFVGQAGSTTTTDFASINLSTFTIEAFIKLETIPGSVFAVDVPYYIIQYKNLDDNEVNFSIYLLGDKVVYQQTDGYGFVEKVELDTDHLQAEIASGKWFWVGVTRNDSTHEITLMLREVLAGTMTSVVGYTSTPPDFSGASANPYFALGAEKGGGAYFSRTFDGIIDEVRISDTVLAESAMLYNTIPANALEQTVAYWKFDENLDDDQIAPNEEGSSKLGIKRGLLSGADDADPALDSAGHENQAFHFEPCSAGGSSGTLASQAASTTIGDFTDLNLATFTIEAFFKLDTLPSANFNTENPYYIIDYLDRSTSKHNYAIRISGTNIQYFHSTNGGSSENFTLNTAGTDAEIVAERWYWIGVTRDDTTGELTVMLYSTENDALISTTSSSSTPIVYDLSGLTSLDSTLFLAIGGEKGGGGFFQRTMDGLIDEVRISNYVRAADDMLYNTMLTSCRNLWQNGFGYPADLNKDCYVDFKDLAEFAASWLVCNEPSDPECSI